MLVLFSLIFAGCTTIATKPSVCDNIPEGMTSVICATSTKLGITPESISSIITITNLSALVSGVYTAEEALAVINTMETFVIDARTNGITYGSLIQIALKYHKSLKPEAQALFIVLQEFVVMPPELEQELLTDYDFALILQALEKQRRAVTPFQIA